MLELNRLIQRLERSFLSLLIFQIGLLGYSGCTQESQQAFIDQSQEMTLQEEENIIGGEQTIEDKPSHSTDLIVDLEGVDPGDPSLLMLDELHPLNFDLFVTSAGCELCHSN